MTIFSELEIGDKLSIENRGIDINLNENNMLNAQLIDINANYLYISSPSYKGEKYSLRKRQKITIFFYRKKGVYQFDAQVVNQIHTNIETYELKPIGDIKKIQRRNYYRLPIVAPVILKRRQNDKIIEFNCITKDLSGGGVKIICKSKLEKFENVVIDIQIDECQVITMDGEVVRVIENIENSVYELGIKFKSTNEMGMDKIFAFIFEKQRLMRKKGLI